MENQELLSVFGNVLRLRVCGVCVEENKVLLIKHRYIGKKEYLWSPPGGGLHFGESVEETLHREFLEETGLEVEIGSFLFVNEFLDVPLHAVELFFEVRITGGKFIQGIDPELSAENQLIQEVAFLSIDDLKKENPLNLHSAFRGLNRFESIFEKKGYFLSKN